MLSTDEAAADASLLIASSLETTSQAITTIFRYLLTENTVLHRLQREIDAVVGVNVDELDYSTLEKLPYLDACVHESLRIMPPAPAGSLYPSTHYASCQLIEHTRTTASDRSPRSCDIR